MNLTNKQKGELGELVIAGDLARKGANLLFKSNNPNLRGQFDLISRGQFNLSSYIYHTIHKIQCKYAESKNGKLKVDCRSKYGHSGKNIKYTSKDIDLLAVYDGTTSQIFYIDSKELGESGRRSITLKV